MAYEMRISDWSSDVCSSDLYSRPQFRGAIRVSCHLASRGRCHTGVCPVAGADGPGVARGAAALARPYTGGATGGRGFLVVHGLETGNGQRAPGRRRRRAGAVDVLRSEEHTSEVQSLMRISYAVFCLKKKK